MLKSIFAHYSDYEKLRLNTTKLNIISMTSFAIDHMQQRKCISEMIW